MNCKIFYRCAMCDINQSVSVEVEGQDPPISEAYAAVLDHHKKNSPKCPASNAGPYGVSVDFLVRMVQ